MAPFGPLCPPEVNPTTTIPEFKATETDAAPFRALFDPNASNELIRHTSASNPGPDYDITSRPVGYRNPRLVLSGAEQPPIERTTAGPTSKTRARWRGRLSWE